jgi:flagellar hook-associated protein 3 FlgL
MAAEIDGIKEQLAGIANASYQGHQVFGGFSTKTVTNVGGNWTWTGDNGAINRRITPDQIVQVNGNGESILGFGAGQTDVFSALSTVASHLRAGNTAALSNTDITMLDNSASYVNNGLAGVGARGNVMEASKTTGSSQISTLKDQRSSLEDVDIAATALEMQMAQSGYQAALAAAARLSMPTLVDFLR